MLTDFGIVKNYFFRKKDLAFVFTEAHFVDIVNSFQTLSLNLGKYSPSTYVIFVETSKKDYPINVADLVFYIFVLCKYCVFDGNIIETGNSQPKFFCHF